MNITHPAFAFTLSLIAFFVCFGLRKLKLSNPVPGRYGSIDGLRGYLAFFVFLHHAVVSYFFVTTGNWQLPPSNFFTHLGQTSVAFFFMITGFLFYGKIIDSREKTFDWLKFFVGRVLRLGPLYLLAMLVLFLLVVTESGGKQVDSIEYIFKCAVKWILFTVPGAPAVNGISASQMMAGVNWSLPYEWYFYLGMPVLAMTGRVQVPWLYSLLSLGAIVFAIAHGASLQYFFMFGGGILAALAVRNKTFTGFAESQLSSALVFLLLLLVVSNSPTAYEASTMLLLVIAFTLIAGGADLFGVLSSKASHTLGELSYSIYLLHGMLLFVTLKYVIGYEEVRRMHVLMYWGVICAIVPLLLIIAYTSFRYVEFPAMQRVSILSEKLRAKLRFDGMLVDDPLSDKSENDRGGPVF